jgi:tripartite-type tricarboxylate transporter receptor subunit TctC
MLGRIFFSETGVHFSGKCSNHDQRYFFWGKAAAMKLPRRQFLHLATGAAALPALSQVTKAQVYPSRPVTAVVPFPAGGPLDTLARILVERMRVSLGQPLIIENVAGANGSIGTGRVARAAPDGYTLVFGPWNTHVANAAVYSLQYDVVKDFAPVSLLSGYAQIIVAKNAVPANTLSEFIAWLTENPGMASQGHPGVGSQGHLAGIFFQSRTGTRFQQIPYRGNAMAIQDLIAGQIDLMIADPVVALPQIQSGRIKAFAIAAKSRSAQAPDVPTVEEAGLPGFYVSNWNALWAPKDTSDAMIARLNGAVTDALADDNVRMRLFAIGQELFARDQTGPEALRAFQLAEIDRWWPIIKAANIKPE